jgi:hypothetical protein
MIRTVNYDILKATLRQKREQCCFPVINRGQLWYDQLSSEQYIELVNWYNAWLDVTKTLIAPKAPAWLNKKLNNKEDIL